MISKSWDDIQKELSIASDAANLVNVGNEVSLYIARNINTKSIPDLEGMQYVLKRVMALVKCWEQMERKRQHP